MSIQDLLQETITRWASDLHLVPGYPPTVRVDTHLVHLAKDLMDDKAVEALVAPLLTADRKKLLEANRELDFAYTFGPGRFRVNLYYEKNFLAAAFRLIPLKVRSIDELGLPGVFHEICKLRQGFVLLTGPTGHGKSTSLAGVIEEINQTRDVHVITLEDPVEYVYSTGKAIVSQREFGVDFLSWSDALRAALREDPDVVLVGEMRDYESIAAAMTIAETGHLVLATLHTNNAAQTVDRIVDVFPEYQQPQVRLQFSNVLEMVISQRLIPQVGGGRVAVQEIMVATPAIRSTIREGKSHQIDNIIQTSAEVGMQTLDMGLASLIRQGKITSEVAQEYSLNPRELLKMVHGLK